MQATSRWNGNEVTSIQSNTSQESSTRHGDAQQCTAQQDEAQPNTDTASSHVPAEDDGTWPVIVSLSNGRLHGADIVISAIGVEPSTGGLPEEISRDRRDGGVIVDRYVYRANE